MWEREIVSKLMREDEGLSDPREYQPTQTLAVRGVTPVYASNIRVSYVNVIQSVYDEELYDPPHEPPCLTQRAPLRSALHARVARRVREERAQLKTDPERLKETVGLFELSAEPPQVSRVSLLACLEE